MATELNLWKSQWRNERIRSARADYRERKSAYASLKDKSTDYALSIKMARDVCAQVLAVWESSPVDIVAGAGQDDPAATSGKPIDMLLFCPKCGQQHIDAPELGGVDLDSPGGLWLNPPHKSHLCHGCGCIWRPADVPTNGVAKLATKGKADTWATTSGTSLDQGGWRNLDDEPSVGKEIDILISGGSTLCGAFRQYDNTYWWSDRFYDVGYVMAWRPVGASTEGGMKNG